MKDIIGTAGGIKYRAEKQMMDDMQLLPGEEIVDLERNGYRVIQNRDGFCFGMDAVLLTGFLKVNEGETVLDLGTGTGVIPILLAAKTEGKHFTGLEIQDKSVDMARRSVAGNHLQDKIEIVHGDIKEASDIFKGKNFDVVVTNPPYMSSGSAIVNPNSTKAISRHEIKCALDDVLCQSARMLKQMGRFYMVHRPARLVEILKKMTERGIEPKRMRMVHPFKNKKANMMLIEGIRGGKAQLTVEPPLVVYKEKGVYEDEIKDIYGM